MKKAKVESILALTFRCMNSCQSAILSLAFRVRAESTFGEVDMHVERAIPLHFLHTNKLDLKTVQTAHHQKCFIRPKGDAKNISKPALSQTIIFLSTFHLQDVTN